MRLLFLVPMYYIQTIEGAAVKLVRSDQFRYSFKFENGVSNDQKWYFLDNGNGYFQIVNIEYRVFLSCDLDKKLVAIPKSLADDSQKWSAVRNGIFFNMVNKLYKVYLGSSNGIPAVSTKPYSLFLLLA